MLLRSERSSNLRPDDYLGRQCEERCRTPFGVQSPTRNAGAGLAVQHQRAMPATHIRWSEDGKSLEGGGLGSKASGAHVAMQDLTPSLSNEREQGAANDGEHLFNLPSEAIRRPPG